MAVVADQQDITELSGLRKAAILLMCLPQESASKLMAALSSDQVEQLANFLLGFSSRGISVILDGFDYLITHLVDRVK